jgi:hypothetical protein
LIVYSAITMLKLNSFNKKNNTFLFARMLPNAKIGFLQQTQ